MTKKMKILDKKSTFLHSSIGRISLLAVHKTTNHLPIDGVFVWITYDSFKWLDKTARLKPEVPSGILLSFYSSKACSLRKRPPCESLNIDRIAEENWPSE